MGAFVGACVLFGMTFFFELKRAKTAEDMAANVVIDYQDRAIKLYTSAPMYARSMFIAAEASKILPKADNGPDRPARSINLSRDFVILGLVSYLLNEQSDWQMARATYRSSSGIIQTWRGTSTPSECTIVTNAELKKQLKDISNAFAKVEQIGLGDFNLCLPPNSSIEIKPTQITILTRVCKIEFAIQEGFLEHMSSLPGTNLAQPLYEGAPRYSTTAFGIRAITEYFALRAQDRLIEKYRDWAKRVVSGARIWLEGPASYSATQG